MHEKHRAICNIVVGVILLIIAGSMAWPLLTLHLEPEKFKVLVSTSVQGKLKTIGFWFATGGVLTMLIWGMISIFARNQSKVLTLNQISLISLLTYLFGFEIISRISISNNIGPFKSPSIYANGFCEDDYWKINALNKSLKVARSSVHSRLGWTKARTEDNPNGLVWPVKPDNRLLIPFYGDSFMEGVLQNQQSIPAQFEKLQPEYQSINFGVAGYGIDQIYLRYQLSKGDFLPGQKIIFGVMTENIDRNILTIRGVPKPYFKKMPDGYQLINAPKNLDFNSWMKENPISIFSYSTKALVNFWRLIANGFDGSVDNCKRSEKLNITEHIIQQFSKSLSESDHLAIGVLFVSSRVFSKENDWRYSFLKSQFEKVNLPFIDTKSLFLQKAKSRNSSIDDFFIAGDGHPNQLGNQLIAAEISKVLMSL